MSTSGGGEKDSEQGSGDPKVVAGTTTMGGEFAEVKQAPRLLPILHVDPSSEDEETEANVTTTSKFIRNGNELRRSLRRINSMTRRKLSPASSKENTKSSKRKHSIDGSSVASGEVNSRHCKVEPDYNSCSGRV